MDLKQAKYKSNLNSKHSNSSDWYFGAAHMGRVPIRSKGVFSYESQMNFPVTVVLHNDKINVIWLYSALLWLAKVFSSL